MILFGTETTDNALAKEAESNGDVDQYQNISRMRGLTMADWDLIEELEGIAASDQNADSILLNCCIQRVFHLELLL